MDKNGQRDLFPGALEMMVLQILRRGPLHGYAIAQNARQSAGDLLQIEEGTLYPALQRLLREGWVDAKWDISPRNRKIRIYRITAAGRKQLERERAAFERMHAGINRVMRLAES